MRWTLLVTLLVPALGQNPKNAEEVFKNITHLKGTPADQLNPAMQMMSASLGVECSFCHVPGKFDADDKPEKKTAREMIAMTMAINKNSFNGRLQVSCYSCHHGIAHPASTPPVMQTDAMPAKPAVAAPSGSGPTADDIIARYVAASGGAEAIGKIKTRVQKGTLMAGGNESPIEVYAAAPNKRVSISKMGGGGSYTAFDGTAGWMGSTGRAPRDMSAAESWAAGLDAEFSLALRLKEVFPQVRRGRPEEINGAMCDSLTGVAPGKPPVRLWFDSKTGLLARMVRYAETPVGRMPTQIDYADYREVDGVKTPFRWTLSRPNGRFTIQIAEQKNNVAIEDGKFQKPAGEVK